MKIKKATIFPKNFFMNTEKILFVNSCYYELPTTCRRVQAKGVCPPYL